MSSPIDFVPRDDTAAPLTRPQSTEARRMRAAELFDQGEHSQAEIARMLGVCAESVRRWKRQWERGGTQALRRRLAPGRVPKLTDDQVERVRAALDEGAQAHGFKTDPWTLDRVAVVVKRLTGAELSTTSVWRLLTIRLNWHLERPQRTAAEHNEAETKRWVARE